MSKSKSLKSKTLEKGIRSVFPGVNHPLFVLVYFDDGEKARPIGLNVEFDAGTKVTMRFSGFYIQEHKGYGSSTHYAKINFNGAFISGHGHVMGRQSQLIVPIPMLTRIQSLEKVGEYVFSSKEFSKVFYDILAEIHDDVADVVYQKQTQEKAVAFLPLVKQVVEEMSGSLKGRVALRLKSATPLRNRGITMVLDAHWGHWEISQKDFFRDFVATNRRIGWDDAISLQSVQMSRDGAVLTLMVHPSKL